MNNQLVTIIGPTAIGKTGLAIKIAEFYKTEIVSADSRQFYRELNIGTAKPSSSELSKIKHHLINSKSIHEQYNINDFEKDAIESINSIFKKNKVAVLVGGSGLFINSVLYGLDEIPAIDENIRNSLYSDMDSLGIKTLQEKLKLLDPNSYENIDIDNPRRLIRALEVTIGSGKPYSSFLKKTKKTRNFNVITIGLNQDRAELYEKINARVDNMIKDGLIDEVKGLLELKNLKTLNTIGYSEVFKYIDGVYSKDECINEIKKNTRRYAKRQLTWFKSIENVKWVSPNYDLKDVLNHIEHLINN
ncbi:MAG: tRNA (adenosine(37)-N6)-dimethylallyltransferase MiaA [Bacteroidota bacterium]|nr:tRNA (adenosine(37)-N6)-dimethylallyltransferase MiaA [Bacteroidota bacterium]